MISMPMRSKSTMNRPTMMRNATGNIRSGGGAYSEREAALENMSARKKEKEDLERLVKMLQESPELQEALKVSILSIGSQDGEA